jgi:hypothetical protein
MWAKNYERALGRCGLRKDAAMKPRESQST